jgi:5-methyltetrahydrofolate--homocysteine methyltransferase
MLLDGGMGTELMAAGLPAGALPERWLLDRPEEVSHVHRAHAAAGAGLVLTCTFNLAGPRLRTSGVATSLDSLARRAEVVARQAAPGSRVAGAVGPTLLAGAAAPSELGARYGEACRALAGAGVDLLWMESQWDLGEARAALAAARATGLRAVLTFTFRHQDGALAAVSGEPALACLEAAAAEGAAAVGFNCQLPGEPLEELLASAAGRLQVPLVAKPSAGLPGAVISPEAFAAWLCRLAEAGASWLGGCCGATPAHLAAAAQRLAA